MLLIQAKKSRKGNAVVLTDPDGEVHACTNAEELWETMMELLDGDFGEVVTQAPVSRRRAAVDDDEEDDDEFDGELDPLEEEVIGVVSKHGASIVTGMLGALQNMSHRGPAAKPRRRRKKIKEGDLKPARK